MIVCIRTVEPFYVLANYFYIPKDLYYNAMSKPNNNIITRSIKE